MHERLFADIDPVLINEMALTERDIKDYAAIALQESIVKVAIDDCNHPLLTLPREVAQSVANLTTRPKSIKGVDLELNYDRQEEHFTTEYAKLRLDNNYSIMFQKIKGHLPGQNGTLFFGALLNPNGMTAIRADMTQPIPGSNVEELLEAVGIGLPKEKQTASWDSIKAILGFANTWSATTTHTTPIDLVRTARITDHVEGSSSYTNVNATGNIEGLRQRELKFAVDESEDMGMPPNVAWQIKAFAENNIEPPCI